MDAAEPDHQHRTEIRVATDAEDDLVARRRHFLHEHALDRGAGMGRLRISQHPRVGVAHRAVAMHPQRHGAGFGLVGYVRRLHLQRHRSADTGGGRRRLIGGCRQRLGRAGDAVAGEQSLGLVLGQQRTRCSERAGSRIADRRWGRRSWRPMPALLKPGVVNERPDRAGAARHRGVAGNAGLRERRHRLRRGAGVGHEQDRLLAWPGERCQLLGVSGSRRLVGERPDQEDRVDTARLPDDFDEPGIADLVDRLGGGIDRVLRRGVGRQQFQDLPLDVVFEHRQFEAMRREDIGHPHRAAAGAGDHSDAVAPRQWAKGEGGGDVEHVIEVLAANDAVMAEDRVVDRPGMRQRAGVRSGGAAPGIGAANLGCNQRLAGGGSFVGNGAEMVGSADRLEIKQKDVGAAMVERPVDIVVGFEDRLVAGADLIGKTELPVAAAVQKGKGQRPALAANRDRAALRRRRQQAPARIVKHRAEGRDDALQRVDETLGIGTADEDAVLLGDAAQFAVARLCRRAALLAKARADHDRGADAAGAAFGEGLRHDRRRDHDHRQIGGFGQIADRGIGAQTQHLALAARHRVDPTDIAMTDQRMGQPAAQCVGVSRGADNGDAFRRNERAEVRHKKFS